MDRNANLRGHLQGYMDTAVAAGTKQAWDAFWHRCADLFYGVDRSGASVPGPYTMPEIISACKAKGNKATVERKFRQQIRTRTEGRSKERPVTVEFG